jgi:type IV pilus assembly protein PilE
MSRFCPRANFTRKAAGFTLLELMVTAAIVAILAGIAMPSYSGYLMKGRIPEATGGLAARQAMMEQYYQDMLTYVGSPACTSAEATNFTFSCEGTPTASAYVLKATGKNSMDGFVYKVDQDGTKGTTITGNSGWTGSSTCWVTSKAGTC